MNRRVLGQMHSPLQRGQSVLTLACGHLFSWKSSEAPPAEVDCPHCLSPMSPFASPELRTLDLAVRNLRRSRAGLPPMQPEGEAIR